MLVEQRDRQDTPSAGEVLRHRVRAQRSRLARARRRVEEQLEIVAAAHPDSGSFLGVLILANVIAALVLGHALGNAVS